MPAPKGNAYSAGTANSTRNNRLVADTLRRIAIQGDGKKLRKVCEAIFDKAETGDVAAASFIADRLDGKPIQTIAGDSENPLFVVGLPWLSQEIQKRNSA